MDDALSNFRRALKALRSQFRQCDIDRTIGVTARTIDRYIKGPHFPSWQRFREIENFFKGKCGQEAVADLRRSYEMAASAKESSCQIADGSDTVEFKFSGSDTLLVARLLLLVVRYKPHAKCHVMVGGRASNVGYSIFSFGEFISAHVDNYIRSFRIRDESCDVHYSVGGKNASAEDIAADYISVYVGNKEVVAEILSLAPVYKYFIAKDEMQPQSDCQDKLISQIRLGRDVKAGIYLAQSLREYRVESTEDLHKLEVSIESFRAFYVQSGVAKIDAARMFSAIADACYTFHRLGIITLTVYAIEALAALAANGLRSEFNHFFRNAILDDSFRSLHPHVTWALISGAAANNLIIGEEIIKLISNNSPVDSSGNFIDGIMDIMDKLLRKRAGGG